MENYLKPDIPATWRAMEELYGSSKARAIGVSNFSCKKLEDLLAVARIPPAANQVECHPVWQQRRLRDLCRSNGVHLSVILTTHSASIILSLIVFIFRCETDTDYFLLLLQAYAPLGSPGSPGKEGPDVLSHPVVVAVAERLQRTPAQVALRWGVQMGQSVLPKSDDEAWTRENIDVSGWCIPGELMAKFDDIQQALIHNTFLPLACFALWI